MQRAIYILMLVLSFSSLSFGQQKNWQRAQECYQEDSLDCAREAIDLAIADQEEAQMAYTWYLRGYIYKGIFQKKEKTNRQSTNRAIAIEAYAKSIELDSTNEFSGNSKQAIKSLAATYYNHSVESLNNFLVEESLELLKKYNSTMNIIQPGFYSVERELPIYKRIGTIFMDKYQDDKTVNKEYFGKAIETFNYVLKLDSTDFKSNLNAGVLYHNEGVELLMSINGDMDFPEVIDIEERHIGNMERALHYMKTAYNLKPDHPGVIRALAGIYYTLHDEEKFALFNEKLLKLEGE